MPHSVPASSCAPAPLHVYITDNMQALYARRGMWINGQPQGVLAGMLGAEVPALATKWRKAFYVTPDQLAELWLDICRVPAAAIGGHQLAQFGRRVREAAKRDGLDLSAILEAKRNGGILPASTMVAPVGKPSDPVPFLPLERPTHGKAAILFQDHVMRTMREFVDFTQSTEYQQGA